jgi:uncharacterized protein (TIGR03437 family)
MDHRGSLGLKFCLCLVAALPVATPVAAQTLSANPAVLNFSYTVGTQAPEPVVVTITASKGVTPALTATVAPVGATPAGLFVLTVSSPTIIVGIGVGTLDSIVNAAGLYTANIIVSAAGFPSLTIPVTLSIGVSLSAQASPASLIFNELSGTTSQSVEVTATGGTSVSFTAAASTTTGGTWLSVTSNSPYTPATLTVTATPGSLAAAVYSGTITISLSTGGSIPVPVTLQAGPTANLTPSPTSFSFSYVVGSAPPAAQVLNLTSDILNNTYTARATSTNNWLLINGVTTSISGALPAAVNVTILPSGLTAGTYPGIITVTSGDGTTLSVPVTLLVNGGVSATANPSSLTFVSQAEGAQPATQSLLISGSGTSGFSTTVTSGGGWLSVSPTSGGVPAQVTVTAAPGVLTAGTYTGNIAVTVGIQIQDIPVTLTVSADPVLVSSPGAFVVSYVSGNPAPAIQYLSVNVSNLPQQEFTISATQPSWLQITDTSVSLTTPVNVSLTLNPVSLPAGIYLTDIFLTPVGAGAVPVTVPVVLDVTGGTAIVANPTSLTLSAAAGGSAVSQSLQLTANGSTSFTASATTVTGGTWLTVSPASGSANYIATPLTVTANPASLASGTYQGTVLLTTSAGVVTQVPITLSVSGAGFLVTPSSLAFAYVQGGASPAAQTLQVSGSQSFTASASTSGGGTWLAVTPTSGTGSASLTVTTTPAGLAAGSYTGTITVTPTGGTALTLGVTLTVSGPGLAASPNPLAFTYQAGDANPAPQVLAVSSTGTAIPFTAVASSSGWLSVSPASGNTPAPLTVSVNPTDLGAGTYSGSIVLSAGSGTAQVSVAVTLMVTAPLPVISRVVNAASYLGGAVSPGEIVVIFGSDLGPSTGVSAQPSSSGIFGATLANVQVTFNGYPAPLLYASAEQVNAIVPYELAGASSASVEVLFGQASSNSVSVPVALSAPGIFSVNASGTGPGAILDTNYHLVSASNPTSPGAVIQIYATGEGQTTPPGVDGKLAALMLPLPSPNQVASVLIGGLPANILYAGAAPGLVAGALQVNAQIPPGAASGALPVVLTIGVISSQTGITVEVQ